MQQNIFDSFSFVRVSRCKMEIQGTFITKSNRGNIKTNIKVSIVYRDKISNCAVNVDSQESLSRYTCRVSL